MGAQPVLNTAHDLALVFQGLGRFDTEFDRKQGDGHSGQTAAASSLAGRYRVLYVRLREDFLRNALSHEAFDYVADFDVAVTSNANAALLAVTHFVDVVLEAA